MRQKNIFKLNFELVQFFESTKWVEFIVFSGSLSFFNVVIQVSPVMKSGRYMLIEDN